VRQEPAQGFAGVADEVHLEGVPHTDHVRVDGDLHGPRLVQFQHELGVREAGADHQQGVSQTRISSQTSRPVSALSALTYSLRPEPEAAPVPPVEQGAEGGPGRSAERT
jgi:hypothetical protein